MQQLHLVGFTTDLEGLIFSARKGAKSGGYLVMLDDRLRATIEDALRLRDGDDASLLDDGTGDGSRPRRPRPQSTLSPREIQARLRTGSSIEEVAAEAGVDEEWVGRFAAPILAEQAQVVARARSLTFGKPRLGESALPLGDAVRWNLADRDVRFLDDDWDAAWSAYSLQGASWVVRFQFSSRSKRQTAEWEVDLREGELFARNRIASDLAFVDASRRRRRPPILEPSPRETPAAAGGGAASRRDGSSPAPAQAVKATPRATGAPRLPVAATIGRGSAGSGSGAVAGGPKKAAAATKKAAGKKAAPGGPKKAATKATTKAAAKKAPGKAATTRGRTGTTSGTAARASTKATGAGRAASAATRKGAKAAPTRRTTGAARGRTTKATGRAAKKPAPEHRVESPTGSVGRASTPPDIEVRRSHLARPASPMPTANRAPAPGTAVGRLTPSPRTLAPTSGDRTRPDEGFRVLERPGEGRDVRLPPPRRPAAPARQPAARQSASADDRPVQSPVRPEQPAAPRERPQPAPQAQAGAEGGQARQRPARREEAPTAAPAPRTGDGATRSTADQRLARRLAARQNGADGRPARTPPPPPDMGDEPVWHGPGSGEPAPQVRIRADVAAAADVRPPESLDPAVGDAAPGRRRRERPLRAR